MKKIKRINLGVFSVLCMLVLTVACQKLEFSKDKAGFDEQGDLGQYSLRLYGFGDEAGIRVADLGDGTAFSLESASRTPEKADLVSFWSSTDGVSLVSVWDIPALEASEDGQKINSEWYVKNETTFIRLEATDAYKERYDAIEEGQDVRDLYEWALEEVIQQPNYDEELHGPYMSVKGLSQGDLVLAKTESGAYVAAWVENVDGGITGDMRLRLKVDKRNHTAIPALDPSEVMDTHEARLARPNSTSAAGVIRFLDVSSGDTYIQTASDHQSSDYARGVLYHQHKTDMVFLNSSSTNHNFRSPDNGNLTSWTVGSWIVNDWAIRNQSRFIRLEQSAYTDSLFAYTFQNNHIRKAWNEMSEKAENDPDFEGELSDMVTNVTEGDLVLFHSESRNTYAMFKVIEQDPAAGGYVVLDIKADNSTQVEIPPFPHFILTGVPGYKFLDFEAGKAVLEVRQEAADYGPRLFDIGHAKGSSSNHNFMSITWVTDDAFDTFSSAVKNRVRTWPVINRSEMIRLPVVEDDDTTAEIYRALSDGDYAGLMAVWNIAAEEQEPTDRLTGLAVGEVVLINSVDRGRIIAARVLNTDNTQTTGSMAIEYKQAVKP